MYLVSCDRDILIPVLYDEHHDYCHCLIIAESLLVWKS